MIDTTRADDAPERAEMTSAEYRALMAKPKTRSKYNNVRCQSFDGTWFDSKAERARYEVLSQMQRDGEIDGLECQPVLVLQEAFRRDGQKYQPIRYRADFKYRENGVWVIEDVKGKRTAAFNLKWKLALRKYPDYEFRLEIVKHGRR